MAEFTPTALAVAAPGGSAVAGYGSNMNVPSSATAPPNPGLLAGGGAAAGPGPPFQQRQLNVKDALSYLDQVKVQFNDTPGVYNHFLDIMKDFKTQSIDTPGVISRVSSLFRGHPALIQGFNTFLPPGFHIEVETPHDSAHSIITVTHPQGNTTQSRLSLHSGVEDFKPVHPPPAAPFSHLTPAPGGAAAPAAAATATATTAAIPVPAPAPAPAPALAPTPASVPVLVSASAPAPSAHPGSLGLSGMSFDPMSSDPPIAATPKAEVVLGEMRSQSAAGGDGAVAAGGLEPGENTPGEAAGKGAKPLEFNHAITYVNKIKNRYANEPQTYQTFLDILQKYQRETRPITEVYEQVNQLFRGAPDLLAEFGQFLPATGGEGQLMPGGSGSLLGAAIGDFGSFVSGGSVHGRAKKEETKAPFGAGLTGVGVGREVAPSKKKRGPAAAAAASPYAQAPTARALGPELDLGSAEENFSPSAPRGTKRKQRASAAAAAAAKADALATSSANNAPPAFAPPGYPSIGAAYSAAQLQNARYGPYEVPRAVLAREELTFFQHAKDYFQDRTTYVEFLKLVNLFTQDLIDLSTLVHRSKAFLGQNAELWSRFLDVVGWREGPMGPKGVVVQDGRRVIENVPSAPKGKVDLSGAPECGTSYRQLPGPERRQPCGGRDELCWAVLNDEWVCGPTNVSVEDLSFLVKPTNAFERALFQAEDERHEYDYHIEANNRTIALLEPINARLQTMDAEARAEYRLKPGLGGQSKSIYQRIIKKVYGKEQGADVINALHDSPALAVPIVLARLKQKDEEWKRALREWNRVWREVDAKNYWKALDHQGIAFKTADKKALSPKALVAEVELIKREQQQKRLVALDPALARAAPRFQLDLAFDDLDVLFDALRLFVHFLDFATAAGLDDDLKDKAEATLRGFLTTFFRIPRAEVDLALTPLPPEGRNGGGEGEPHDAGFSDGDASDTGVGTAPEENLGVGRGRKRGNGGDLRKKAMRNTIMPLTLGDRAARRAEADSRAGTPALSSRAVTEEPLGSSPLIRAVKEASPAPSSIAADMANVGEEVSSVRDEEMEPVDGDKRVASDASLQPASVAASYKGGSTDGDMDAAEAQQPSTAVDPAPAGVERQASLPQVAVPPARSFNFFCNSSYYTLVRLLHHLYTRLETLKRHAAELSTKPAGVRAPPVDNPAGPSSLMQKPFTPSLPAGIEIPARGVDHYPAVLALAQAFNAGDIEQAAFDEGCRVLFPTKGYLVSTVDKLCQALVKILSKIAIDEACASLTKLFEENVQLHLTSTVTATQQLSYRRKAEAQTGGSNDPSFFRLEWVLPLRRARVQLIGRDDIAPEDLEATEKAWADYVESWSDMSVDRTIGLEHAELKPPILKRNLAQASQGAKSADPALFDASAGLGVRVCMRSYRLFFSPGTEEYLARRPAPTAAVSSIRDGDDETGGMPAVAGPSAAELAARVSLVRKKRWDKVQEKLRSQADLGTSRRPVEIVDSPAAAEEFKAASGAASPPRPRPNHIGEGIDGEISPALVPASSGEGRAEAEPMVMDEPVGDPAAQAEPAPLSRAVNGVGRTSM